jgi:TusA-related sulfurtransferase
MQHEYDATQDKCPLPLVKMRVMLRKMDTCDSCLIKIADKGSIKDIPKFLSNSGYSYTRKIFDNGIVELLIQNR